MVKNMIMMILGISIMTGCGKTTEPSRKTVTVNSPTPSKIYTDKEEDLGKESGEAVILKEGEMVLPTIADTITTDRAIELCKHFGYDYLVERIKADKGSFKDWKFDGASMVNDERFKKKHNIPNLTKIALKHDLKYAYGEKGNEVERLRADLTFALDILNDGASPLMVKFMFEAIDVGGDGILNIKTSYTWGFARK